MSDAIDRSAEQRHEIEEQFGSLDSKRSEARRTTLEQTNPEALLLYSSRLQKQMEQLMDEQDVLKAKWEEVEAQREKERNEVRTLRLQLQEAIDDMRAQSILHRQSIQDALLLSNVSPAAPVSDSASAEDIASYLEPKIVEAVRHDIMPMLMEFRSGIEHSVETHTKELYETLWPMLTRVFNDVSKKI